MFYTRLSDTPSYDWKPGKAYATAEAAEVAARALHKLRGAEIDIVRVGHGVSSRRAEYVATILTDALGKVWTQVAADGCSFL